MGHIVSAVISKAVTLVCRYVHYPCCSCYNYSEIFRHFSIYCELVCAFNINFTAVSEMSEMMLF